MQAVVNWSTEPAQSIVLKNIRQLGFGVPVFQSHGFGNLAYAAAAGKRPRGPSSPAAGSWPRRSSGGHPQKKLLVSYRNAYLARFKEEPSTFGGHAYDSFGIIAEA